MLRSNWPKLDSLAQKTWTHSETSLSLSLSLALSVCIVLSRFLLEYIYHLAKKVVRLFRFFLIMSVLDLKVNYINK